MATTAPQYDDSQDYTGEDQRSHILHCMGDNGLTGCLKYAEDDNEGCYNVCHYFFDYDTWDVDTVRMCLMSGCDDKSEECDPGFCMAFDTALCQPLDPEQCQQEIQCIGFCDGENHDGPEVMWGDGDDAPIEKFGDAPINNYGNGTINNFGNAPIYNYGGAPIMDFGNGPIMSGNGDYDGPEGDYDGPEGDYDGPGDEGPGDEESPRDGGSDEE